MANPTEVSLTAGSWVKVATNATSGIIERKDSFNSRDQVILRTYRATGDPAPTDEVGAVAWEDGFLKIEASAGIDVYLKPLKRNTKVVVAL